MFQLKPQFDSIMKSDHVQAMEIYQLCFDSCTASESRALDLQLEIHQFLHEYSRDIFKVH